MNKFFTENSPLNKTKNLNTTTERHEKTPRAPDILSLTIVSQSEIYYAAFRCLGEVFITGSDGMGLYNHIYGPILRADEFSIRKYFVNPKSAKRKIREYIRYRLPLISKGIEAAKNSYEDVYL